MRSPLMDERRTIERLVIFGATGDLAERMLLPSLYYLDAEGLLPERLKIIGAARSPLDRAGFVEHVLQVMHRRVEGLTEAAWARFRDRLDYSPADVTRAEGLKGVA